MACKPVLIDSSGADAKNGEWLIASGIRRSVGITLLKDAKLLPLASRFVELLNPEGYAAM